MLIVSRNFESLRILIYLCGRLGNETTTRDIADALDLPLSVCRKRTWQLRDAGLVTGARGYAGGVKLASQPDEMPIGDVVAAIEAQRRQPQYLDLEYRPIFDRAVQRFFAELNRMTVRDVCPACWPSAETASKQTCCTATETTAPLSLWRSPQGLSGN
jgi:Rrf2 family nitric oxide-sensitive transcriptional repressor